MDRPKMKNFIEPKRVSEYPLGSTCKSDHITSVNSGWRTFKPVINNDKCTKCLRCFLVCPDGAIDKSSNSMEIDYDFCKGCGVCATECKLGAIDMIKEDKL
jgi:pyruvate ferredoxin oxidoreductase delta subunit